MPNVPRLIRCKFCGSVDLWDFREDGPLRKKTCACGGSFRTVSFMSVLESGYFKAHAPDEVIFTG